MSECLNLTITQHGPTNSTFCDHYYLSGAVSQSVKEGVLYIRNPKKTKRTGSIEIGPVDFIKAQFRRDISGASFLSHQIHNISYWIKEEHLTAAVLDRLRAEIY